MKGAGASAAKPARLSWRGAQIQREYFLRLFDAAQCVATKRVEPGVGVRHSGDELGGDEHRAGERLA